jgi:hypothetical protein
MTASEAAKERKVSQNAEIANLTETFDIGSCPVGAASENPARPKLDSKHLSIEAR